MKASTEERVPRHGMYRFAVAKRLLCYGASQGPWLEVSSGAAEFGRILRDAGYTPTLVDLDQRNVARGVAAGLESYVANLEEGLPRFADASFVGASALEIVEHVVEAEGLLGEIHRVLTPGGVLVLSTPNIAYWLDRIRAAVGLIPAAEGYHYRFFNEDAAQRLIREAGFEIVHCEMDAPLVGVNWWFRLVRRSGRRVHVTIRAPFGRLTGQTMYFVAKKA